MAPGPTLKEDEHLFYTGPFPLTSLKLHVVSDKCCQETLGGVSVNHHGTVTSQIQNSPRTSSRYVIKASLLFAMNLLWPLNMVSDEHSIKFLFMGGCRSLSLLYNVPLWDYNSIYPC